MAASKASGLKAAMEDASVKLKRKWALVQLFVVLSVVVVVLCVGLYAPRFSLPTPHGAAAFFRPGVGGRNAEADDGGAPVLDNQVRSPCSSMPDNSICCDRSDYHSDVCFMAGDVRTHAASLSLLLFPPPPGAAPAPAPAAVEEEERIRPYTRKWDGFITKTIHEVTLLAAARRPVESTAAHRCDVRHDAPVFVVTAAGYSHNLFHVFNDGFLPSWLTVQHLHRRVVLAVLAYNPTWARKYGEIISGLSGHHVVDLLRDNRTHCFPGAIVGTRYHDYLAVDPARLRDNKTIVDFHNFLAGAYKTTSKAAAGGKPAEVVAAQQQPRRRPRLGIVSRKGRRVIENQAAVADLAASVGFDVDVLETGKETPLSAVHASVSALDALVGVHGADLTAFLFLRPDHAALVQVAPLGIVLLSRNLFGVPAARMGLRYEQYDVRGDESSLSRRYSPEHVVVADPGRARREQGRKEWDLVEKVYLRGQNVSLDLGRFRETLERVQALVTQRQASVGSAG